MTTYRIPNTETFIIDFNEQSAICYSPLKNEIALIDTLTASILRSNSPGSLDVELKEFVSELTKDTSYIHTLPRREIRKVNKLSIIPNNICNLACSYCYSALGRNNSKLSIENIDTGLDWFIDRRRIDGDSVSIFITGGGEPLTTWDTTSHVISKARELAEKQGLQLYISLITNGTLLDDEKIQFLKDYSCPVGVSFDVLEDIQNTNRGKYNTVSRNIKRLLNNGMKVMINSTIIPSSVSRITEAVDIVVREYPGLAQYTVEPVTGTALFGSPIEMRSFYDKFFDEYFRAKEIATNYGLKLRFTFDDSLRGVTPRHCPGKFALTPSGHISVCHLVSSSRENRFDECTYGIVADGNVTIDDNKFDRLYSHNVFAYEECTDCLAKWSCGGECFTRRSTYPPEYMSEVCRFNRKFIEQQLKEMVKDVKFA
jgi:radical SAM protein with 4Fe4S-binding SPASM domain